MVSNNRKPTIPEIIPIMSIKQSKLSKKIAKST
jgi:hypothetical protein